MGGNVDWSELFDKKKQEERDKEFDRAAVRQSERDKPTCGVCFLRHLKHEGCFNEREVAGLPEYSKGDVA